MLKIQKFVCNMLQENCYVVSDETGEAVIIDCGVYFDHEKAALKQYISANGLKPVHLLATHGHIDHNVGNKFVLDTWRLMVEVHEREQPLMSKLPMQAAAIMQLEMDESDFAPVGRYLHGNDVIRFGRHQLTLIETPGHSPGGVFFYCEEEKVAFSGDTLFRGSIGRTDFIGGSRFMIIQSLRMISQMPDDVVVYPGHAEETTIGEEVAHNPYIDR